MLKKVISVLTKKKFHRGQIVYQEGKRANKVYLVWKGEFELERKLPRAE